MSSIFIVPHGQGSVRAPHGQIRCILCGQEHIRFLHGWVLERIMIMHDAASTVVTVVIRSPTSDNMAAGHTEKCLPS